MVSHTVAKLYEQFPRLQCRVQMVAPDIINQTLLDRSTHLGIALAPHDNPNLVTVRSYQCGLACVMRSDHPLAKKKLIKPADLAGVRVISSPESVPFGQTLKRVFGAAGARMHRDFECTSSTTACWFAQAGVGVAVVDEVAIAGGLLAGLEVRPFQSTEKLPIRIIRNRYRYRPMSVAEKAFVDVFDQGWGAMVQAGRPREGWPAGGQCPACRASASSSATSAAGKASRRAWSTRSSSGPGGPSSALSAVSARAASPAAPIMAASPLSVWSERWASAALPSAS